jgi:hypothetical protein
MVALWLPFSLVWLMMDKFKKLVAVAEDMASKWNQKALSVEGICAWVEEDKGFVKIGTMGIVGVTYSHDDNCQFPENGVVYTHYTFDWIDGEWKELVPTPFEVMAGSDIDMFDELPF